MERPPLDGAGAALILSLLNFNRCWPDVSEFNLRNSQFNNITAKQAIVNAEAARHSMGHPCVSGEAFWHLHLWRRRMHVAEPPQ